MLRDAAGVVGRSQGAHEVGLGPRFDPVEDMDVQPALLADKRREKTDRARAGHEHGLRLPEGPVADRDDLLPRLGDDGRRLEQHAQESERRSTFMAYSGSIRQRSDMKPSICLDAALGVLAVPAHVPLAHRAVGAGHGVGAADDADHQVAFLQPAARARVDHPAEGFVAEHEARLAGRRPAVLALDDLDVGAADADGDGFHENRTVARVGLRNVLQAADSRVFGSTVMAFTWRSLALRRCLRRRVAPSRAARTP